MTSFWDTPFRQMMLTRLPTYAYKNGVVDVDFRKISLRKAGVTLLLIVIVVSVMAYA